MPDTLAAALAAHQAGDLDQAEAGYRRLLAAEPDHPDALHLLGVIRHQRGADAEAVALIGRAIALRADNYKYHYNLAAALQGLGRHTDALEQYRRAAALAPPVTSVRLALAHLLHSLGRPAEAEPEFRRAIAEHPVEAAAHAGLGSTLHALGRLEEAAASYRKAVELQHPEDAGAHFILGSVLQALGRLEEAEDSYRAALGLRPDHPPTLVNLGTVLHGQGRLNDAAAVHRRALKAQPDFAPAHVNLGAVLQAQGKMVQAVKHYRKALALNPIDAGVLFNLGTAVQTVGWLDEAIRCYRDALRLWPSYAEAANNLGQVLEAQGHLHEAAASFAEAVRIKPDRAEFHNALGCCLYALARRDPEGARDRTRVWLAAHPDQPIARHMASALLADGPPPEQPPAGYVRTLFEGFAPSFEHELLSIGYCGPQLMATAFARIVPVPNGDLEVLDAGCGTGLCAPVLKPWARRLTGVDVSPRMLELARRRGLYDVLEAAELTEWLPRHPGRFDLIAAADVLCYSGDLGPLLAGLAGALKPGGALAFTAEQASDPATPYRLAPHGRYLHGELALRATLAAHGLSVVHLSLTNLRDENGGPSPNLVVLASRS